MTALPPLQGVIIPVTPFQQNCSLVWCSETKRAAVVDPGGEVDRILAAAEAQGVVIEKVLVTHGHLDHAGAAAALAEELAIPIEGPQREDAFWIDRIAEQGARYGMTHCRPLLIHSITTKLWPLGDDVTFVPGHGPLSTFGRERLDNPFVADRVLAAGG